MNYFEIIATDFGVSTWLLTIILIWSLVWKLIAMWKSARNGSILWFIILALFNTIGILPIFYIFVFSKMKCCKPAKLKTKRKKKK